MNQTIDIVMLCEAVLGLLALPVVMLYARHVDRISAHEMRMNRLKANAAMEQMMTEYLVARHKETKR